jgi:Putative porin
MRKLLSVAVSAALFSSAGVQAAVSDAEWEQFKADFAAMSKRVSTLEAENQQLKDSRGTTVPVEDLQKEVAMLKSRSEASAWTENIGLKGDFRYRYENIDEDGKSTRDRNRIRARAALTAKTSETTSVVLGVASGGDNPVSSNQTLGSAGSSKDLNIDLAYFTWTGLENTSLRMGKFSNNYRKVQKSALIFDGDYRPEGISLGWAGDMFFATANYQFIESDSKNDDDGILGLQVGATFNLGDAAKVTTSAMYLDIPTEGRNALDGDDFFGNSSVDGVYAYDYSLINASVDVGLELFEMPFNVYLDYVENTDADDLETGYIAGVKLGKAKAAGSWQVQYQYQVLEADATWGALTDSDFVDGGTDGEGHKLSGKYAIDNKWTIAATYFDNNTGVDLGADAGYKRLMIDTVFKY